MKLRNPEDRALFLTEVTRLDLLRSKEEIPEELFEIFLKRRTPLVQKMKDFRKSQRSKRIWDQNRWKIMTGIKAFHRSAAGKRFHRNLGRLIATRIFRPLLKAEQLQQSVYEHLKALSSVRTHMYIESGYFMNLDDDIEFQEFSEYAIPLVNNVELQLFQNNEYEPTKDETELLIRIVDLATLRSCIEEVTGINVNAKLSENNANNETTYYYVNALIRLRKELMKETT